MDRLHGGRSRGGLGRGVDPADKAARAAYLDHSLLGSFIGRLFIPPDRQGMGVGRKLISHALARHGELSLEVYTANEQAARFYSSLGFRELSRRDVDDFGSPFPNAALHLKA